MQRRPIEPPSYPRLALEQLSVVEYGSFMVAGPFMRALAKGDGHPVLVLPGFGGSDRSTEQLRGLLRRHGHAVHGWHLGRNTGGHPWILDGLLTRLQALRDREGQRVSLVGWSLGGIFARELARDHPDLVRQVITMAAPYRFREGDRGHASRLYNTIGPGTDPFPGHVLDEHERPPLPVPATSIYTRSDGIVRWHACIDSVGPLRENIEVRGTHTGLGYNIAAAIAVADRLSRAEGAWKPFRPRRAIARLYPKPASWVPRGDHKRWVVQES